MTDLKEIVADQIADKINEMSGLKKGDCFSKEECHGQFGCYCNDNVYDLTNAILDALRDAGALIEWRSGAPDVENVSEALLVDNEGDLSMGAWLPIQKIWLSCAQARPPSYYKHFALINPPKEAS